MRRGIVLVVATLLCVASIGTVGRVAPVAAASGTSVTITYSVGSAGAVSTGVESFARHVATTLADARGWSMGGSIRFVRVSSNASMNVLLAAPSVLGGVAGCSSMWSCRAGQNVYINEDRWLHDTPTWTLGLDAYRHYVVNHEVGHFLGLGHASCPGPGLAAPVMMQQSKGSAPCRDNVWPFASERGVVAGRYGVAIVEASKASMGYVAAAYLRVLQRMPSRGAQVTWAMGLDDGSLSRTGLVAELFASSEFARVPGRVARLYSSAFDRPSDVRGLMYWGDRLQHGYPPRSVATYFARSDEFVARYGHLDNAGFVDLIYRHVLGRSPDSAGASFWVGQLASGTMTRGDVLFGLSESSEHRRATNSHVVASVAYTAMLNQTPPASGLAYWAEQIDSGTSIRNVVSYFRSRDQAVL